MELRTGAKRRWTPGAAACVVDRRGDEVERSLVIGSDPSASATVFEACVWIVIGGLFAYSVAADWRSGQVWLPRPGRARRSRSPLLWTDYPVLFVVALGMRIAAAILLALLLTGRLLPLLQWGV